MTPSSMRAVELQLCLCGGAFKPGLALGHSFGTPPRGPAGQRQSPGLDLYDLVGLTAKFP
jgi:hypothetical protein